MQSKWYGKYERGEWLHEWSHCPHCEKETLEFLISEETHEVIGCTECTVTVDDEQYMVDVEDTTYLQCPRCEKICDTLYADKKTPYYVDGCENCLAWVDSFEED